MSISSLEKYITMFIDAILVVDKLSCIGLNQSIGLKLGNIKYREFNKKLALEVSQMTRSITTLPKMDFKCKANSEFCARIGSNSQKLDVRNCWKGFSIFLEQTQFTSFSCTTSNFIHVSTPSVKTVEFLSKILSFLTNPATA